ncbi:hypothetical protein OIU77_014277 [Salix suchowensis]|uniref:Uncharacterized protein n=1 Tax=Salix suchowensis TaxID=1278906 RepID=A0ABQ8ZWR0_9ROSI|nr:hypothetical protein OIU77_014277 [Salix suchowensis]
MGFEAVDSEDEFDSGCTIMNSRQLRAPWRQSLIVKIRCLCWNCRGARNKRLRSILIDSARIYNPDMIVLVESRISREIADGAAKRLVGVVLGGSRILMGTVLHDSGCYLQKGGGISISDPLTRRQPLLHGNKSSFKMQEYTRIDAAASSCAHAY